MRKVGIVGKNKLFSRRKLKNCVIHCLKTMRKVGKIKCGWIARERTNLNHNYIITEPLNIIQYFKKKVINLIKKINANQYGVVEYAVSNESEVAQLPHLVGHGSTCIVIATSNVYMFDGGDSSWHSLVDGSVVKPKALDTNAIPKRKRGAQ